VTHSPAESSKVFDSIKKIYNLINFRGRDGDLRECIKNYVNVLRQSCKYFCYIVAPNTDKAFDGFPDNACKNEIKEYSSKLVRMDTTAPFIPILIALRLSNNRIENNLMENYLEVLKLCELFAFRAFLFMEKYSNVGERAMYSVANRLFKGECDYKDILNTIKFNIKKFSSTAEFKATINRPVDSETNNWYDWKGLKYFLFEYEIKLAADHNLNVKWEDFQKKGKKDTIEHILPRAATDDYWTEHWTEEDMKNSIHDIGNLGLLSK
jgi:hypothetical protein